MPTLRTRFNYAFYSLTEQAGQRFAGVKDKCGATHMVPWLGFIDVNQARSLKFSGHAVAVRLTVEQYSHDNAAVRFDEIPQGKSVLGCLTQKGVYGVTEVCLKFVSDE